MKFNYTERLVTKECSPVYVLGDYVPPGMNRFRCSCGVLVGWNGPYSAPLCPKCHPESLMPVEVKKMKPVLGLGRPARVMPGLYTDYSERNRICYLGFAVVESGTVVREACVVGVARHGETEAVQLAKSLGLGLVVYCDHAETCRVENVMYIKRNQNPAHRTAKSRLGLVDRESLGKVLRV